VRCPACSEPDDKVVDSRQAEDGSSIRRRRECLGCGRRFTTFERLEEVQLVVVKRSGEREAFDRSKILAGVVAAAEARPVTEEQIDELAVAVEDELRLDGRAEATTERVGMAVLERLPELDAVTAVRFASVYKGFDDLADFQREVTLLAKRTEPKRHDT
jgi:transcriptional repressor NrdR